MSPLTYWHYLLLTLLGILLLLGIILSFRTKYKFSVLTTVTLMAILFGLLFWNVINEHVYRVEISQLQEERFYQSEQILIKGVVRNVGDFPVANVVATVLLSSGGGGSDKNQQSLFSQPTVFAEIYNDDNPDFKVQNVVEEHLIAEYLNPGKATTFRIMMDYPPHFRRASYDVTAKVN